MFWLCFGLVYSRYGCHGFLNFHLQVPLSCGLAGPTSDLPCSHGFKYWAMVLFRCGYHILSHVSPAGAPLLRSSRPNLMCNSHQALHNLEHHDHLLSKSSLNLTLAQVHNRHSSKLPEVTSCLLAWTSCFFLTYFLWGSLLLQQGRAAILHHLTKMAAQPFSF